MYAQQMYELGAKRSCIRELFEYGRKQAALVGKENVFDFSIGNPSIPSPECVRDAFFDLLSQTDSLTLHGYTSAPGCDDAREAVATDLNTRFGTAIRPQNLFFTCGAAPALIAVIRALGVEGAEIAAIAPYFPEYRPYVESNGVNLVVIPADTATFQIPVAEVEKRLTPHTQAILINSPNNPTGVIYSQENLEALARVLNRKRAEYGHPIYIIADEPYRELVYDGAEVPFIPTIYPNTIVCYSWSKSLSMPGERIGYIYVPDQAEDSAALFAAISGAARASGHVCAPALQQRVAAHCVGARPDLAAYDLNRRTLYEALTSYGYRCVKPNGAFYLFVRAPRGSAMEFSEQAKKYNLLVVPGDDFGCPEFFRVSTCVSLDMIQKSLPIFKALAAGEEA